MAEASTEGQQPRADREQIVVFPAEVPSGLTRLLGWQDMVERGLLEEPTPLPPVSVFPRFVAEPHELVPDLFKPALGHGNVPAPRYVNVADPQQFLIFTAGAQRSLPKQNPTAGFYFHFRPQTQADMIPEVTLDGLHPTAPLKLHTKRGCGGRIERRGPTGMVMPETQDRAHIRAAIAALQYRHWTGEGFRRLVIATNNEALVSGMTEWLPHWERTSWRNWRDEKVRDQDLWKELIKVLAAWREKGLEVSFWLISERENEIAIRWSGVAAKNIYTKYDSFTVLMGALQ